MTKLRNERPAYGGAVEVGFYLGANSASTARRYTAELRASGLPVYILGGRKRFRFVDVDKVMAARGGEQ